MPALTTPVCDFGEQAHAFSLSDTNGNAWSLEACRGKNGLLLMFISNHCPYVQAIRKKIVRDATQLQGMGIGVAAIMSNDTQNYQADSQENMKRVALEYFFPFPYLLDDTQAVASVYGAVCTPDFFGYNSRLELQYRGRLDASGARPDADDGPRELFEAMKQVAETGKGPIKQIPSIGCSIKWRE